MTDEWDDATVNDNDENKAAAGDVAAGAGFDGADLLFDDANGLDTTGLDLDGVGLSGLESMTNAGSDAAKDAETAESTEEDAADDHTDDDLHARVDIALTGGGLDGSSCGDDGGVALVLDGVDKLFHRLITSFFLKFFVLFFVVGKNENEE